MGGLRSVHIYKVILISAQHKPTDMPVRDEVIELRIRIDICLESNQESVSLFRWGHLGKKSFSLVSLRRALARAPAVRRK